MYGKEKEQIMTPFVRNQARKRKGVLDYLAADKSGKIFLS